MEIWKPIPGYEDYYLVSNHGRIKSLGGRVGGSSQERILKQKEQHDGYLYFRVNHRTGGQKYLSAHRTVALVFIPNPDGKSQINHKDFDKKNNRVENLEWVTPKENIAHSIKNGVHKNPPLKVKQEVPDFDLPDVSEEGAKASAPRIHIGGDTCVSCEG